MRFDRDHSLLRWLLPRTASRRLWGLSIHCLHATGRLVTQLSQLLSIVLVFLNCTTVLGQDLRAEKIQGWDFQRQDDQNHDKEPDGWRRRRDRQHPAYIVAKIVPRDRQRAFEAHREQLFAAKVLNAFESGRWDASYVPESIPPAIAHIMDRFVFDNCLEVTMDGGSAEIVSPLFPVDPRFSYSLAAEASCLGLDGHEAWAELQLLDGEERLLESLVTSRIGGTVDWQKLSTSVASNSAKTLRWGRVHLKVAPRDQLLIHGLARFDSIGIHRLPRLSLTTELPEHVALPQQPFAVKCAAMGIRHHSSTVRFELRDHLYNLLDSRSIQLVPTASDVDLTDPSMNMAATAAGALAGASPRPHYVSKSSAKTPSMASANAHSDAANAQSPTYDGTAVWELQLETPGLYRVSVALGDGGQTLDRQMLIGVLEDHPAMEGGPFGWSIHRLDQIVAPEDIPHFVERYGAGWVKFPVWFELADTQLADRLVKMTERLQALGTQCVGRLDQPPSSQRELFGEGNETLPALSLFRDSRAWEPVLEPVLTRMGLKLDWFQIGSDSDHSFQNHAELTELISEIRSRMQTYSQELKLAMCWMWLDIPTSDAGAPWNALHFSAEPELTAAELFRYANESSKLSSKAWVSLNLLDENQYELLDRVRDMTERMVVVKQTGVAAAFVLDPFESSRGLFRPDRSLGELLIPWTNVVAAIGDKNYLGTVDLPGSSQNHAFASNTDAVMLVWNDVPGKEQLHLGSQVTATDVWGRHVPVEQIQLSNGVREQRFQVDQWPIVVRGIDARVVRWRQQFKVELDNLASTIGELQELPLTVVNTLDEPTAGKLALYAESLLGTNAAGMPLQLPKSGRQTIALPLSLRPDASAGKHSLRFDVDTSTTAGALRFSVYRNITLGAGDIEFKWDISRKSEATVELRIELTNNTTEPTSFDCKYFPAGQPYQRFQVLDARPGITLREISLNLSAEDERQGAWIRCEEIGTGRILNYRLAN